MLDKSWLIHGIAASLDLVRGPISNGRRSSVLRPSELGPSIKPKGGGTGRLDMNAKRTNEDRHQPETIHTMDLQPVALSRFTSPSGLTRGPISNGRRSSARKPSELAPSVKPKGDVYETYGPI